MISRGDILIASERGVLTGKPRPVLVVQANAPARVHPTVTACLISTRLTDRNLFRIAIQPTSNNGLIEPSEIQVDHLFSFSRSSFDRRIGCASTADMKRVDEALRRWLSL